MTGIRIRCRRKRSACPAPSTSIATACGSSPAALRLSTSGNGSRAPARRCRSTAPSTSPPSLASGPGATSSGSICSRSGAEALAYLTELTHRRTRTLDPRCRAAARAAAGVWRGRVARAPSRAASPNGRSARSTSRTISTRHASRPCRLIRRPAADDTGSGTPARRAGPGRRRRPEGRRGAPHLDAA